jgi:hypothetical protein
LGPLVGGLVEPLGALGQGLLATSGDTVVGQLKQGLVSIAPDRWRPRGRIQSEQSEDNIFQPLFVEGREGGGMKLEIV